MSAIRVEVTAEHCQKAGPWPKPPVAYDPDWRNPVELAITALAGVAIDVDGDEDSWHATIGSSADTTLVVTLPDIARERLDAYYGQAGSTMEPFSFDLAIDEWLVALVAKAVGTTALIAAADAVIQAEADAAVRGSGS